MLPSYNNLMKKWSAGVFAPSPPEYGSPALIAIKSDFEGWYVLYSITLTDCNTSVHASYFKISNKSVLMD